MPLKLKKTAAGNRALNNALDQLEKVEAKAPSLEALREKYELGTIDRVAVEAEEFSRLKEISTEATNATNRQKTQIKKAVTFLMREEKLKPSDKVVVGDEEFRFDVTRSEKIDLDAFFEMYKEGKITEQQFKGSITVNKGDAERLVGAHVLNSITEVKEGKKADVRVDKADKPSDRPIIVRADAKVVVKPEPVRPVSAKATPKRAGTGLRPVRRIRT